MSDFSVTAMGILGDRDLTDEILAEIMTKLSLVFPNDNLEPTRRILENRIGLAMSPGEGLTSGDQEPWIADAKASIKWTYWEAYVKQLNTQGLTGSIIRAIDEDTDNILTECGNPANPEQWRIQGLVMGDVQSGKTGNYCGLINKAADAGYKVIVLLTGTIEELRSQSQERMDEGFVGEDSNDLMDGIRTKVFGAGRFRENTIPNVLTSVSSDFLTANQRSLKGIPLQNLSQPVLLVMKKNMTPLKRLIEFIKSQRGAQSTGQIDQPLLLIDDEADNASVNAKKDEDPAKINLLIRDLVGLFKRSSYVGYTATPFANVFINPDSQRNDLFPNNFIYSLKAPTNYVGASAMFTSEGSQGHQLVDLDDAEDFFPARHNRDLQVDELPPSLKNAVATFLLSCAIRDLREEPLKHRSMLVNVSRFTDVQSRLSEILESHLYGLMSEIRQYLSSDDIWDRHPALVELKVVFDTQYSATEFPWDIVRRQLYDSVASVKVLTINQRTEAENKLNYRKYKNTEKGRRVIAVGGLTLSRGLTLEGLSVSYFYRHSKAYDTLLQMARWFGYRTGYDDICRVWMHEEATSWFEDIAEAVAELRADLRHMYVNRLPPSRFGIRVRSHPKLLLVTAKNKMRNSSEVDLSVSFSSTLVETTALFRDPKLNEGNLEATAEFVRLLGQPSEAANRYIWKGVHATSVARYLSTLSVSPINQSFLPDAKTGEIPLIEFIKEGGVPQLRNWDVCVVQGNGRSVDGIDILTSDGRIRQPTARERSFEKLRSRAATSARINKHRLGEAGDERVGLGPEIVSDIEAEWKNREDGGKAISGAAFRERRVSPLLVIHLIQAKFDGDDIKKKTAPISDVGSEIKVAISLSFPSYIDTEATSVTYRVNKVYLDNIGLSDEEDEADE
ncbi:Z1 domain-containing protein [Stenotrophomonas sp. TWI819]|uniref:Z1 domain-containing protein n=1 Tax=Stenotrophomonas sp. TWI819 TaxID=3136800 RepID=UPI00320AABBB